MLELSEDLSKSRSQSEILDVLISEEDVYESLCKIDTSKACGPDEVPGHLLREGAPWLAGPLTKLFQLSLSQSCLPSDWTSANITKKGNKHSLTNYRPISLTCLVVLDQSHMPRTPGEACICPARKLSYHKQQTQQDTGRFSEAPFVSDSVIGNNSSLGTIS